MTMPTKKQFSRAQKLQKKMRRIYWEIIALRIRLKNTCEKTTIGVESVIEELRHTGENLDLMAQNIDPLHF